MRLSTVFELLLIFLFLALASSRHIDKKRLKKGVTKQSNLNQYCKCTDLQCNCCRDFPVVPIKGPGCASLGYQSGDALRLTMSFGDRVLRNITLTGKRPKPVCMGLPGGISKFCGRLYNIERIEDHFKACLSLELRALDELEAALRVSCFNFGPKGVKLEPGEPLPSVARPSDEDDDDDDDDDYDIDDEDDEFDDDDDEYNDVDTDGDYTGFAALSDQIFEGFFFPTAESSSGNKKKKPARPATQGTVLEITTEATSSVLNDTKEVSTTEAPQTVFVSSTTERFLEPSDEPTKIGSTVSAVTAPQKVAVTDSTETTDEIVDSTSTESLLTKEEKENETEEDSASEEEAAEAENDVKVQVVDRDEEESNEGSAEEELDETENEDAAQAKVEDDDEDDDDDEDESDEEHESAEHDDSPEEKDEDNILNVFFNHDDDSTEKERERTRMEREKFKKILPGLMALLQPSPTPPTDDLSASFAYPAVRSARVHRRMRLPPI